MFDDMGKCLMENRLMEVIFIEVQRRINKYVKSRHFHSLLLFLSVVHINALFMLQVLGAEEMKTVPVIMKTF